MLIDAHHHVWQLSRGDYDWLTPASRDLYRDFSVGDLAPELRLAGVERTVLVQAAASDFETDYILEIGADTPWIAAVIGWVDLRGPATPRRLAALGAHPRFRGVRPMLQDDRDAGWILRSEATAGLRALVDLGLGLDALVRWEQLPLIAALAKAWPDLSIVLDHGGKPPIADARLGAWTDMIAPLAAAPNVTCKLSGLVTEANGIASHPGVSRVVSVLLDRFGPERIMWGSDWPVLLESGSYTDWLRSSQSLVREIAGEQALRHVFADTASRTYRMSY